MASHRMDPVSLIGAVVFLSFGLVGLLRGVGWIEHGSVFWVAVVSVAGLGCVGAFGAIRGLVTADSELSPDELVLGNDS